MSKTVKSLRTVPKWILLICAAFIVMQYLICRNVFLMGDDYMYGAFSREGIVSSVFSYYFTGNGRWLINLLDCLQLLCGRFVYVILTPWLLLLLGVLLYRLICLMTGSVKQELLAFSLGLLSLIDVQMTRESTYWITGAINYLVPAVLLLAGMIASLRLMEQDLSRRQVLAFGAVCVLSCLTMEQFGLMTFGWMLLIWGFDCLRRKTVPKRMVMILLLSFAALCSILFAPANRVRIDSAAGCEVPVIFKVNDLICYDYYSMVSAAFWFVLAGLSALRLWQKGKKILSVLSAVNGLVLLGFHNAFLHASFKLVCVSLLATLVTIVPTLIAVFRQRAKGRLFSLAVIGGGSQLMLLATELWGFRTSLSWVLLLIIGILVLVCDLPSPREFLAAAGLLCAAIHPILGVLGLLVCCWCLFRKKGAAAAAATLLLAAVLVGLSDEVLGYQANREVHLENIRAAEAAENGALSQIVLRPFEKWLYGWNSPPLSEFHESYFRKCYGIPDQVLIRYDLQDEAS